jgi:carboxymethylenebutenolidase
MSQETITPISERKQASDYPQELLNLFDKYVHGDIDRRAFLDGAQKFAVGGVTATMLWESLRPNYAWAQQVPPTDARIKAERVSIDSPAGNGKISGYFVKPANATGKLPAVVVIHENRGLNPYIEDVARRLATAGFMAVAPDGLTSVGGYPGDEEKAAAAFRTVDGAKMQEDLYQAAMWIHHRPDCTGKLGAVGFCFGGGVVNNLAVRLGADLAAGVPFYGAQPKAEDAAKIKAAMLLNYAQMDERIDAGIPAFEAALKGAGVKFQTFIYEGTQHGFHNDTTPRYNEAAAKLAWQRTLDHFNKNLKG